jgi:hypothetical protein
MNDLQFFNPYEDIRFTANRLPHWQQKGAVYFVTFRLGDAVPHQLREKWESDREAWLRVHPQPWSTQVEREYHNRFSDAIERWLDAGYGSCVLQRHDCAAVVAEALRHFDGERIAQNRVGCDAESRPRRIRAEFSLASREYNSELEGFYSAAH